MKVPHSFIVILCLAVLLLTTVMLVQRQLAQQKRSDAENASVANARAVPQSSRTQSRRVTSDGLEFERTLARDVPFSATQIIETTESLADGNTAVKTSTSMIYRDRQGRTRRDSFSGELSSAAGNASPTMSIINDPILGFSYILDHRASLVRRAVFVIPRSDTRDSSSNSRRQEAAARGQVLPMPGASDAESGLRVGMEENSPGAKTEALGTRDIEGVLAEGTRISMTVPRGTIGNEQPVEIVMERWYSPTLQTVVLVKRNDPRRGGTTYRLTGIKREDPAAALFMVPRNYRIYDELGREISADRRAQ
jgi:hypothetical protein